MRSAVRPLLYLWAGPASLLGLVCCGLALATGGGCRVVGGVLEVYGGAVRWILRYLTVLPGGAAALTLGHVVLGLDPAALAFTRVHERVHVRQYERWGPLFIPLYLLASLALLLRGRDPYRQNPFEREAFRRQG